jgi:hypothetical protein
MPIKTSMTSQPMSRRGSPSSSSSDSSTPHSPSTLALLSLTQDITALISLSVEATASLVHDWFKSALGMVGAGDVVRYQPRGETRGKAGGEAGRGLAVVVVGANEGKLDGSQGEVSSQLTSSYWPVSDAPPGEIWVYRLSTCTTPSTRLSARGIRSFQLAPHLVWDAEKAPSSLPFPPRGSRTRHHRPRDFHPADRRLVESRSKAKYQSIRPCWRNCQGILPRQWLEPDGGSMCFEDSKATQDDH